MSESLRAMLHRMADEIADKVAELVPAAPAKPGKSPPAKRVRRGPVIVKPEPMPMTPEMSDYADRYVPVGARKTWVAVLDHYIGGIGGGSVFRRLPSD